MRKIFLSVISFLALCALVGCGTSSSNTISVPPNPSGGNAVGYTNANLAAGTTYVFTVHGTNSGNSFATIGTFVTDGNGNITSGTQDLVNDAGGQALDESITGTYSINQDGRGQAVINGSSGQAIYRFVLHYPSSHAPTVVGELFQDGTTSSNVIINAIGTIQQVTGTPATPAGAYVVRLDGYDPNISLYGAIGGITIAGTGITGTIDENDSGTYSPELTASGTYTFSSSGRSTAALATPSGRNNGTHHFIVYYVSPTHFELLSTDTNFFLHGYATLQSGTSANTAAFTGPQVFSISGFDLNGARTELGRLTLNGDGTLSNAVEDYDTVINYYPDVSLTTGSSYTVGATGRWTANLVNSSAASTTNLVGWQISSSQSIVLTANPTILETGTMLAQTLGLTDSSVTGNYAESLAGVNPGGAGDVELIGNLLANGAGAFTSGTYDDQTGNSGLSFNVSTTGSTYTIDPTLGRGSSANIEGIPVVVYSVDPYTIFFISAQQLDIYQGALVSQTPPPFETVGGVVTYSYYPPLETVGGVITW